MKCVGVSVSRGGLCEEEGMVLSCEVRWFVLGLTIANYDALFVY